MAGVHGGELGGGGVTLRAHGPWLVVSQGWLTGNTSNNEITSSNTTAFCQNLNSATSLFSSAAHFKVRTVHIIWLFRRFSSVYVAVSHIGIGFKRWK